MCCVHVHFRPLPKLIWHVVMDMCFFITTLQQPWNWKHVGIVLHIKTTNITYKFMCKIWLLSTFFIVVAGLLTLAFRRP